VIYLLRELVILIHFDVVVTTSSVGKVFKNFIVYSYVKKKIPLDGKILSILGVIPL
jgi:hypothetical protein